MNSQFAILYCLKATVIFNHMLSYLAYDNNDRSRVLQTKIKSMVQKSYSEKKLINVNFFIKIILF